MKFGHSAAYGYQWSTDSENTSLARGDAYQIRDLDVNDIRNSTKVSRTMTIEYSSWQVIHWT